MFIHLSSRFVWGRGGCCITKPKANHPFSKPFGDVSELCLKRTLLGVHSGFGPVAGNDRVLVQVGEAIHQLPSFLGSD